MPEFEWQFTLVLLTNGVMIGLMYALIALGLRADLQGHRRDQFRAGRVRHVRRLYRGRRRRRSPGCRSGSSAVLAIAGMIALGFGLERVVLRPLIGRPVIAVVMATIGLAAVLRGVAVLAFGAGTRAIVMPVGDDAARARPGHAVAGAARRRRGQHRLSRRASPGFS